MSPGAVSRYKVEPELLNCQGAEPGWKADAGVRVVLHLGFVIVAGAKAKTVTSLLTQPSVL